MAATVSGANPVMVNVPFPAPFAGIPVTGAKTVAVVWGSNPGVQRAFSCFVESGSTTRFEMTAPPRSALVLCQRLTCSFWPIFSHPVSGWSIGGRIM